MSYKGKELIIIYFTTAESTSKVIPFAITCGSSVCQGNKAYECFSHCMTLKLLEEMQKVPSTNKKAIVCNFPCRLIANVSWLECQQTKDLPTSSIYIIFNYMEVLAAHDKEDISNVQ